MNKKNKNVKALKTRSTTEKMKFDKKISLVIGIVNIIAVALLLFAVFRLKLLPSKISIPVIAGLFLVAILTTFWLIKSRNYFSKIVTLLVTVAILILVPKVSGVASFLSKVTGANKDTHVMNVIVMKDSKYASIADFKDLDVYFGANTTLDNENIKFVKQAILDKDKINIATKEYSDYQKMAKDLYGGKLEVMLLSDAHSVIVEEDKPNFSEETKIIASYEYTEEINVADRPINRPINVNKDTFSIFVTGIDTTGPVNKVSRSDVNMIVTVNPVTHQILLTSIPRDYHVTLHSKGKKDKLTHAGLYGVMESVNTLEDLLSSQVNEKIEIDYYLRVNFTSVTKIVDALGGVVVNSLYDFKSVGGYTYKKGENVVNGKQALSFVRERKNVPGGDNTRIRHQQALITGVINKAMSPAIITNFSQVLNSVGGSFELSMSDSDLNTILRKQIDKNPSWEIIDIQLKGKGASSTTTYSMPGPKLYVTEPDLESVKYAAEMILKMMRGEAVSK